MLNNNKQAFIFDMDGVLTDNMRFHADSWVELFSDFGLQGLDAERYLVETAGMKGLDVLRYFLDPQISEREAERLTELKDFLYRVMSRERIKAMPGLGGFLDAAEKRGVQLGIGTGAGPKNIEYVLGLLNMTNTFQAIVDPSQVRHGKPEPDIFLRAASLLNAAPSDCIVFEDALPGVEAARKAGMQCVAVTTTNQADAFSQFDNVLQIIDDFTSLCPDDLLRKLNEKQPMTLL
ncbi:beta-phosphoglucomutase family hydrolase [Pelodictyon phaeoclathratiforme]|jgi:beta-phosphoglucomutase|uniref:Beta-phosphoglucomutase family hydrolase n=1 Tax=Pelodictyon phaeoclathratiforme (strain DSM 5477 / BU-1) TaxID=324925 RepID=B4SH33_PELPB|nr:beta-phosphoglucomutase family hydrolase [Pelodictyon phaeoclathratiforme]ACF45021.1 beta-phosphoglucomutase family hydrolase [Pelodictyon phaeoclathratiforme BU-1]MBV5288627.1 beta-phosphoglucomutase family hydrolase [Pelodictyon phaeoclathratiforme]